MCLLCCFCVLCVALQLLKKVKYFVSHVLYLIHSGEKASPGILWWPVCISAISVPPPHSG